MADLTLEQQLEAARQERVTLQQQLEAERAEREYAQAALEDVETRYKPIQPIVEELLSDEEARNLYEQAKKGREAFLRTQTEQPPAWAQPLFEKVNKLDGYVDNLTKREKDQLAQQERANAAQAKAWTDSATNYLTKLNETVPGYLTGRKYETGDLELTDDGMMMVNAVSTYARKHQLSFEDAYKRVGDRFKPSGTTTKQPPTSLAPDASEPGILSDDSRRQPAEGEAVDFADELERRLQAGGRTT